MTEKPLSRKLLVALGALSAIGPLSMDLYLPGLPSVTNDLHIDASLAQATLSASLLGLAFGQPILGPLSDRYGRRTPLLIGLSLFAAMSLVCAAAPNVAVLLLARFLQGVGGSSGIVISRAIIRDLTQGAAAARAFGLFAALLGIAPIAAPLIGGALLLVTSWRGVFVALAVAGIGLITIVVLLVPDTLPAQQRMHGGLRTLATEGKTVTRNGRFMAFALVLGLGSLGLFSYVSMSAMVFQNEFGLSEQQFSVLFASNAVGILISSSSSSVLASRFRSSVFATTALSISTCATLSLLLLAIFSAPFPALLVPVFFAVAVHGAFMPNVTALAMAAVSRSVGTASAVLGTLQLGIGAIVPPLMTLGGVSITVMAATMFAGVFLALILLLATLHRARN